MSRARAGALAAIGAAAAIAVVVGAPTHADPPASAGAGAHGPGEERALAPGESFVPGIGAHWKPTPQAAASVSSADAIAAAGSSPFTSYIVGQARPEATLANFTNEVKGTSQSDGTTLLEDKDVTVWVLRYPNMPQIGPGNGPTSHKSGPCDVFVVVDAETAALREAFQSCGRLQGK